MSIQERIRLCQLIEKMEANKEECIKLGLKSKTSFHGQIIVNTIAERGTNL